MLVLGRKFGEKIKIGDDVTVQIVGMTGTTFKVGIEAPQHVEVHRLEVYERVQKEKEEMANRKNTLLTLHKKYG